MRIKPVFFICLLLSLALNIYFFKTKQDWETAFFKVAGTIAEVEIIFKASGANTSYENILAISNSKFGGMVKEVKASSHHIQFGADEKALQVLHGQLLFKKGVYYGIELPIPNH